MSNIMDRLINHETGEFDLPVIWEAAKMRATKEYGSSNYPPRVYREALVWCNERATNMRIAWQQAHGIDPWAGVEMVKMNVPEWGNSGDSYAKR